MKSRCVLPLQLRVISKVGRWSLGRPSTLSLAATTMGKEYEGVDVGCSGDDVKLYI